MSGIYVMSFCTLVWGEPAHLLASKHPLGSVQFAEEVISFYFAIWTFLMENQMFANAMFIFWLLGISHQFTFFSWLFPPSFNYYSSVGTFFFCYLRIFVHANNTLWLLWSNSTFTFLLQLFSCICNIFSLQLFVLFYFKTTESTQCYLYVYRYQSIESHREVTSLKKNWLFHC